MPLPERCRRGVARAAFVATLALLGEAGGMGCAQAAPPPLMSTAVPDDGTGNTHGPLAFLDGVNRSAQLLGDMWGLRTNLSRYGVSLVVEETSEYLGNLSGGVKQDAEYDGLTQIVAQMDTRRAFGHYGGTFNLSVLNIHGNNLSSDNLQSLQTASGIEADPTTRLWEFWYDQKFLDEDRLDVKFGQQSLDQEFMVSSNALYFVNTMFGWPMLPSANMPAGGPAYPLSALGVRAAARPVNGVNLLAGLFNGSPVRNDKGTDPQLQNHSGIDFPTGDGFLAIMEAQFSYPALGALVDPDEPQPLGWTYRIGAWYNSRNFADQRLDAQGHSLADPASSGTAQAHPGNYAIYAVADRLVWRDDTDPNRTVGVFARVMGTPLRDRNLIDFSANLGVVFRSPFRYRAADTFGIGWGYAHVSPQATQLDVDNINYGNNAAGTPVRSSETFVELTYQYQLKPWIQIQPDIQYIMNPGAGVADPSSPLQRLKDELIFGVRTNISF